jgi:D-arabinose 1-dehydrogenase-like Zn-dependent alcohol dehydrogenase
MKAAVMHAVNQPLVIEDVPEPELDYGEVLVATKACGICGTDLHIIDGTGYKPKLPHILGHEPAGVVAKIGEGVTKFKLGDRVVPNIFFTCGECFFCRTNRETMCTNFRGALGVGINGGYAEYFNAPAKNLFILPDKIGFNEGSVIADAVVTSVHAVRRRAMVKADDVVVVIGLGGAGQSVIQIAKHSGAKVFGVARRAQRVLVGEKFGADHIINSSVEDVGQAVNALTNGNGADIVIDNVGTQQTLMQALSAVHRGGRIVMVGETEDTIPLSTFKLCVNELDILGSRSGGRQDTVEAIQLVESGVVTPFASDVFPLEQINEAFDSIKQGKIMGRAVISLEKS